MRVNGENRTPVTRATVARSATKLHSPLRTSSGFLLSPATQQEVVIFKLTKKGIKILSRKAQLEKPSLIVMGTTPHFSCHKNTNFKDFLNLIQYEFV